MQNRVTSWNKLELQSHLNLAVQPVQIISLHKYAFILKHFNTDLQIKREPWKCFFQADSGDMLGFTLNILDFN